MVALSATLPQRVRRDVIKKLQISPDYVSIDVGNNCSNVSLVARPIHNAMNSFTDLDFVIPEGVKEAHEIPHTMIYYDNVMGGSDMQDYLSTRLPTKLQDDGVIRLYSAAFSSEYRDTVMEQFRNGKVHILICTDAAGMVCVLQI